MERLALIIVVVSGLWLIAIGFFMAVRPQSALRMLSLTASTWRINLVEQGLRMLAGIALIVRAESSKLPDLFQVGGWFVVLSSLILIAMPLRWHAAYAIWWSHKLRPWSVRTIAPLSVLAGAGLIYAAI